MNEFPSVTVIANQNVTCNIHDNIYEYTVKLNSDEELLMGINDFANLVNLDVDEFGFVDLGNGSHYASRCIADKDYIIYLHPIRNNTWVMIGIIKTGMTDPINEW